MAEFYSARGWEIPPFPWTNLSPPFSGATAISDLLQDIRQKLVEMSNQGITA